jgi:monofunctional biosynthetic peptidoglycan transglycosylase
MEIDVNKISHWIVAFVAVFGSFEAGLAAEARVLFDGGQPQTRGSWTNVNDGVMGGVSTGKYGFTPSGELRFFGSLSLANNGGFASVRSRGPRLGLQQDDELWLRVRGDGRVYNLDLRVPSNRMAFTYRVTLQTKANQWIEFRVPMSLFRATSFGRVVSNMGPMNAPNVNSIGFTISDKKQGPFKLDVDWIRAIKATPKQPSAVITR